MKIPVWAESIWSWIAVAVLAALGAGLVGYDMSFLWQIKDYWYALVSAVIGAMIGIRWTIGQFAREHENHLRRCVARLRACLQFNVDRLGQAKNMIEKENLIPNYPFDTAQLNHWLIQSYDQLDNDLLRDLDWQRYQLDHISAKLVVVNQVTAHIGTRAPTPEEQEYMTALCGDLLRHVNGILVSLPPLIQRLPAESATVPR